MKVVELYSKEECHLCEIAKNELQRLQRTHEFELRVRSIQEGDEYFEKYKERVPVVLIDNEFAFQYHIPEHEFLAKLGQIPDSNT